MDKLSISQAEIAYLESKDLIDGKEKERYLIMILEALSMFWIMFWKD